MLALPIVLGQLYLSQFIVADLATPKTFLSVKLDHSTTTSTLTTPAPALQQNDLLRRDIHTCGYISGDPKKPLACPASYTCRTTSALWACCNEASCLDAYNKCVDNGNPLCESNLDDETCSSIYGSILSCPTQSPTCFLYKKSDGLGNGLLTSSTLSSLSCGSNDTPVLALATPTNGGGGGGGSSAKTTSSFNFLASTPLFSAGSSASGGSGSGNSGSNGNSDSSSNSGTNTDDGGGLSHTAKIALIAIGVVVALGLIVSLIFWCWCCPPSFVLRRRMRKNEINNGTPSEWYGSQAATERTGHWVMHDYRRPPG